MVAILRFPCPMAPLMISRSLSHALDFDERLVNDCIATVLPNTKAPNPRHNHVIETRDARLSMGF
jgi:hypothetical protein